MFMVLVMFSGHLLEAQKYISEESAISFFSEAPLENIKAENTRATSIFDIGTGEIVFSVPNRGFEFPKSLMQKHFNENYMESEIYPTSTFRGNISGYGVDDGTYKAIATGTLNIHGVDQNIEVNGVVDIKGDQVSITASFPVSLEDYNIKIPRILFSNIAEVVDIDIEFIYKPYVTN